MKRTILIGLAMAMTLGVGQALGQTPDPKADLAALQARAAADAGLAAILSQLQDNISARANRPVEHWLEMMGGFRPNRDGGLPLNYRVQGQVQIAEARAQAVAEILRSDLDGNWQVARDELVASLSQASRSGGQAATAFLLGDTDGNGTLDTAEIKLAAEAMTKTIGVHRGNYGIPRLLDFDDDGILTQSEYDRGVAALKN